MKKLLNTKVKDMKAITLIALVITIVVLIILAAVAINLSLGNNGIFNRAKTAKELYQNAQAYEGDEINKSTNYIDGQNVSSNRDSGALAAYPVGSIYLSTVDTNPGTIFGGTWTKYAEGKTLIGEGTNGDYTFNTTTAQTDENATTNPKGVYKHQLTVAEMPSHTHRIHLYHSAGPDTYTTRSGLNSWNYPATKGYIDGSISEYTGGSQSHNNIQPYVVTYMWQRVS